MPDDTTSDSLHLPSLSIRGFRGINRLDIERLGRVTLLAGRNGVGKTTVLEAVELLAARGDPPVLADIVLRHEEHRLFTDSQGELRELPDYESLFYGREPELGTGFSVAPCPDGALLGIEYVLPFRPREWKAFAAPDGTPFQPGAFLPVGPELKISFDGQARRQPLFGGVVGESPIVRERPWPMTSFADAPAESDQADWPDQLRYSCLGPDVPDSTTLADQWDDVALTPGEAQASSALQLATGTDVEGVAAVGRRDQSRQRRILVKPDLAGRVPLRSMGDGAVRIFGMSTSFAGAAGGFLLIDEAENGIHHRLQREYWAMVLCAAREYNVQVLATTHSWDCIAGFAQAAYDDEESEGLAVRLEADDDEGGVRAVEYTERMLKVAADQGIEVR